MSQWILVGAGGFLGAVSRFGVSQMMRHYYPHPFPLATLSVNVLGCFCIGLLFSHFKSHPAFPQAMSFAAVGFLGAFTTFSAFGLETVELAKGGEVRLALANVAGSVILCLAAVVAGQWAAGILK